MKEDNWISTNDVLLIQKKMWYIVTDYMYGKRIEESLAKTSISSV